MTDLFRPSFRWTGAMEASLERDGHLVLPGVLQPHSVEELTAAVQRVQDLASEFTVTEPAALAVVGEPGGEAFQRLFQERGADSGLVGPGSLCAEVDDTMGRAVSHPQLIELMRSALGGGGRDASSLRFNACVLLNRLPETAWAEGGMGTHSHACTPPPSGPDSPLGGVC